MATKISKDQLFNDFYSTTVEVVALIESTFGLPDRHISGLIFENPTDDKKQSNAKEVLETSDAWKTLSHLYDYAVDGVLHGNGYTDIEEAACELVIGGAEIISLITTENMEPDQQWDTIISMGDGRFALDTGSDIEIVKLALLADVDIRTVRNAVSAGELKAEKVNNIVHISNQSAISWLGNRRSFKPTRFISSVKPELKSIKSPAELGAFLHGRRESLALAQNSADIDASDIKHLESGAFKLPLSAVRSLADFYQIPEDELLSTIMKVFFPEQLRLILDANQSLSESNS